jgi:FkbM family methyltransferase
MTSTITLTLNNTAKIVVPDSLDLITPYVLQEQQDWFEDEIKFLRSLLQPGQKIIDIGANYGVYTLSMAQTVGKTGKIWAFEPASSTAKLLAAGIEANGFNQVIIDQSALSHTSGAAELSLHNNSELNSLIHDKTGNSTTETVRVSTLDECFKKYAWQDIDFIKIDAEGEEINILQGGQRFFDELSPLVQYEIRVSDGIDLEIVKAFALRGYSSYRLVPGLNLLIPFDINEESDPYLLNLFCCKPDRAEKLANQGFLLDVVILADTEEIVAKLIKRIKIRDRYGWRYTIAKLPYGEHFKDLWEQHTKNNFDTVNEAMSFYALSRDSQLTGKERFVALKTSFEKLLCLCDENAGHLRLASLARIATDFGARIIAVQSLQQLCELLKQQMKPDFSEPFLLASKGFDQVAPQGDLEMWFLASILETLEHISAFSSFYSGLASQPRLEFICNLGLNREEMSRRLLLIKRRFDLPNSQLQNSDMN